MVNIKQLTLFCSSQILYHFHFRIFLVIVILLQVQDFQLPIFALHVVLHVPLVLSTESCSNLSLRFSNVYG